MIELIAHGGESIPFVNIISSRSCGCRCVGNCSGGIVVVVTQVDNLDDRNPSLRIFVIALRKVEPGRHRGGGGFARAIDEEQAIVDTIVDATGRRGRRFFAFFSAPASPAVG